MIEKVTILVHPDPVKDFWQWRHFEPNGVPFNICVLTDHVEKATIRLISEYGAQKVAEMTKGGLIWRLLDGSFAVVSTQVHDIPELRDFQASVTFWNWYRNDDYEIDAIRDRRQIREMINHQHPLN